MISFRDMVKKENLQCEEDSGQEAEFMLLAKKLGKERCIELLGLSNTNEANETPVQHLRTSGFKIKREEPTKRGIELEFYKESDTKSAKEDLESAGFGKKYTFSIAGKFLEYIEL